jgi:hypothetical protein
MALFDAHGAWKDVNAIRGIGGAILTQLTRKPQAKPDSNWKNHGSRAVHKGHFRFSTPGLQHSPGQGGFRNTLKNWSWLNRRVAFLRLRA